MTGLIVKGMVASNVALSRIQAKMSRFSREESGATAVEYALIVGLIAVAIIVAVTLLGSSIKVLFNQAACAVKGGVWDGTAKTCSI
ncbi:MAG: Flp family type IVb pilin [Actinomycetes bacterium]